MDPNTEILQKILDKLDAMDSALVGIQQDVETMAHQSHSVTRP